MADEHRRVEPRGIVGSGMHTDAERIEQLEQDRARVERSWRDGPKRKFGEVMSESPARPTPEEGAEDDDGARQRPRRGRPEEQATASAAEDPNADADADPEGSDDKPLPRGPPDPRVARLHAMLDQGAVRGADRGAGEGARPSGRGRRRP